MAVEIHVPVLGESIVDAVIATWHKHEGEEVKQGEALLELETDKINVEVPAEQSGILQSITKKEGDTVAVGEVIGIIGDPNTQTLSSGSNNGITNGVAAPVPVQNGNSTMSVWGGSPAPQPQAEEEKIGGQKGVTPLAKRVAEEHHVDLSQVKSSNPGGKVMKEDVLKYLEQGEAKPPAAAASPAVSTQPESPPKAPTTSIASNPPLTKGDVREERVRLSRRRQTIAQRLVEAQHSAAMLTTFNEVDMTNIMEVRSRRKNSFKERHNVSLGFMSFFTKAVVGALKAFPKINSEIQGSDMVLKHYYDIGIAVGAEEGLVVPVLRNADRKSFAEIEREIGELAVKARANSLSISELQGGTFTITNGGVYGSLLSTPILNAPQVGILGMHKIEERPIAFNGQVVIRPMMYLALSYDHRVVDGSEAVKFLVRVKELLEDPETLLLEG